MINFFEKIFRKGLLMTMSALIVVLLGGWIIIFKIARPALYKVCLTIVAEDSTENLNAREERFKVVQAETVALGTMSKRINTVGHLRANATVILKSEMSGKIKEILFTEGSNITEGDVLITFEDSDANAELKQAEGELLLRETEFSRISSLHGKNIESGKKLDEAKAALTIAQGKVDGAKAKLEKTVIKSPLTGKIGLIHDISKGSFVQAAQELVTVVDIDPIKIDFKVPEKYVNDVGPGQIAEIKISAFKDRVFSANVDAVDPKIESESHSMLIRASIENADGTLKPGLFCNVSLIIGEKGNTIRIPESAVDREGEIEFVWIVERGKADRRRVLTGARESGYIEIVAGLQPGQIVVTDGMFKLSPGSKVKISNMDSPDKLVL